MFGLARSFFDGIEEARKRSEEINGRTVNTALHQSLVYCKDFGSERFLGDAFCSSASSR
jgi:hypothetical protein